MRKSNSEHLAVCMNSTCCDSNTIAINSKMALLCVLVHGIHKVNTPLCCITQDYTFAFKCIPSGLMLNMQFKSSAAMAEVGRNTSLLKIISPHLTFECYSYYNISKHIKRDGN